MKRASCMFMWCGAILLAASARAAPAEESKEHPLPGSRLTVAQAMEGRFGMIAVCEATGDPRIESGTPPNLVTQQLRPIEVLAGKAPAGALGKTGEFSYRLAAGERAVRKGERVIWIAQAPNEDEWETTKALADTPENRKAVAGAKVPTPK